MRELRCTEQGKKNKVADDVLYYHALDDGNIMYVSDSTLKLYDGKNSRVVAKDIDAFWTPHQRETIPPYTYYYDK